MLPAPLRLRKEAERLAESVPAMRSEQEVREAVTNLNQRIRDWRRFPLDSPIFVALVDEAAMVSRWQQAQSATLDGHRPGNARNGLSPIGTGNGCRITVISRSGVL